MTTEPRVVLPPHAVTEADGCRDAWEFSMLVRARMMARYGNLPPRDFSAMVDERVRNAVWVPVPETRAQRAWRRLRRAPRRGVWRDPTFSELMSRVVRAQMLRRLAANIPWRDPDGSGGERAGAAGEGPVPREVRRD